METLINSIIEKLNSNSDLFTFSNQELVSINHKNGSLSFIRSSDGKGDYFCSTPKVLEVTPELQVALKNFQSVKEQELLQSILDVINEVPTPQIEVEEGEAETTTE